MIIPVILSGGSGTRLWPLSRQLYPKQLMNLVGQQTMLQSTLQRFQEMEGVGRPIIICNDTHRFMVAEQLREMSVTAGVIILEPVGRNTAPAVAVGALKALESDPDPVLLVLPADHYISEAEQFRAVIGRSAALAARGKLITFGIVPSAPETGYGYIRRGERIPGKAAAGKNASEAFHIAAFVEKPNQATAENYLAAGDYYWNSGMFMFTANGVLSELTRFCPDMVDACRRAVEKGKTDLDFFRLDREAFEACPGDSIDYAVMEKTDRGAVIPFDAGWSDVGSWEALWQVGPKDDCQNVVKGDVLTCEVANSYLHATSRLIAAVGLENHIVVETSDAILISPRERVQEVKRLVDLLKDRQRVEALAHKKEYRPWGFSETMEIGERFQVNRVTVKPGGKISLQKHFHRAEHWVVLTGTALVTRGDEQFVLKEDESTYIPLGVPHRLENPGKIDLEVIEVHTGAFLGQDDIVRLDDAYGRY